MKSRIQKPTPTGVKQVKQVNIKPVFVVIDDAVPVLTCSINTNKQVQEKVFTCFTKAEKQCRNVLLKEVSKRS